MPPGVGGRAAIFTDQGIYYDPATNTWRGYGAVQPNPGKRIKLWNIWFSGCSNSDCNGPNDVFLVKNGDQLSSTYQRLWIDALPVSTTRTLERFRRICFYRRVSPPSVTSALSGSSHP